MPTQGCGGSSHPRPDVRHQAPSHQTPQGAKDYGIHTTDELTVYREWAPAAQAAQLIGDFNGWKPLDMSLGDNGVWFIELPHGALIWAPELAHTPLLKSIWRWCSAPSRGGGLDVARTATPISLQPAQETPTPRAQVPVVRRPSRMAPW